jgi:hypothetical protein
MYAATALSGTYYVSPGGSDSNDGLSAESPWRTLAKVNSTSFSPGDTILFIRGGEWRESLIPSSSGTPELPIVFSDYGMGSSPKFWGSDLLINGSFQKKSGTTYKITISDEVTSVLVDQEFLLGGTPIALIDTVSEVTATPESWLWDAGTLYINTGGSDPRTDGRVYSAVIRDDVIFAQSLSNIVFRNLAVDESARYDAGYGVRIENSSDITMEDCRAYRCGKHHFGVINTTGFVGRRLYGAYAMPAQGNGGATTYVPYSDFRYSDTTSEWLDCVAEHMEDTYTGGSYPAFVTHGEGIGSIVISNMTANGTSMSIGGPNMTLIGGHIQNGKFDVDGSNAFVSGLHISGPDGGINVRGDNNLIENCLVEGGLPITDYHAMITIEGESNTVRYCTILMSTNAPLWSSCIALRSSNTHTRWYGNIMMATKRVFKLWNASLTASDIGQTDYNVYNINAEFIDNASTMDFPEWTALGYDGNSLVGDPDFTDNDGGDFRLLGTSLCIDAGPENINTATDFNQVSRPLDGDVDGLAVSDIGAFEHASSNADTDGDGFCDADEVAADTNAGNAQSKLAFIGIRRVDNDMQLDWIGGRTVRQVVEVSTNISHTDSWQAIYTNEPPTPITNSLHCSSHSPGNFYRLKAGSF